jgi:phenylalanyl-tRNA synthetase beta chain
MILDDLVDPQLGIRLLDALALTPDVIFDISVEGNRPDAWSIEGVARDLCARLDRVLRAPALGVPNGAQSTDSFARAGIEDAGLCGRLTVSVMRHVRVTPSPPRIAQRLRASGMRPISNVVDASNYVMLELGQPTHAYDAAQVAGHTLRVRRARAGETLVTLDGVTRQLAEPGRGLGDTGVDGAIVDGDDQILGLAGVMGGEKSGVTAETSEIIFEAAYFDPMVIARSSKRHGLHSEASHRFERGVDPENALRAVARFVEILKESVPELEWLTAPLDVRGDVPASPTVSLVDADIEALLGVSVERSEAIGALSRMDFAVEVRDDELYVTAPTRRPDIREGLCGRADVIEEIARVFGYSRITPHQPAWPDAGGLTARQHLRRHLRDVIVDAGAYEAWTPSLGSDADFDLLYPTEERLRVTNPLSADESVLRRTLLTGLVRAWAKNAERGIGDVVLAEFGAVFTHPSATTAPRPARGGLGGAQVMDLPRENERVTVLLGRAGDDAVAAVGLWRFIEERLGLSDVVVRACDAPPGFHPTRAAALVDRESGTTLGFLGEVDSALIEQISSAGAERRVGVIDLDLDVLADPGLVRCRRATLVVPSRFPSAAVDLALVTPRALNAADLALALRRASELVESVTLFDVYEDSGLGEDVRSLAYSVRFSAPDRTLDDNEIAQARTKLIEAARDLGAALR